MAVDELRVEVVVEVPRGGRNKYEWDAQRGVVVFNRRVVGAVAFPADYGFVPGTQASDADPLDALVLLDEPTYPGVHVPCRVLGAVLIRSGDNEPEPRLICVALGDPAFADAHHLTDLPGHLVSEVEQFFAVYKELEDSPTPTRPAGSRRTRCASSSTAPPSSHSGSRRHLAPQPGRTDRHLTEPATARIPCHQAARVS